MTFDELMADHSVIAIRREKWCNPKEHLILPPIINGHRGAWCTLYGYDGNAEGTYTTTSILALMCNGKETDWEAFTGEVHSG